MLIHPDTNKPVKIKEGSCQLPLDEEFKLTQIQGSPSDGYNAIVVDARGKTVAEAVNHMDGKGWVLYAPKLVVPVEQS